MLTFIIKLLLILIALFIILLTAFLLIPFYYHINFKYNEGLFFNFEVDWTQMLCIKGIFIENNGFDSELFIFNKRVTLKSRKKVKGVDKKNTKESTSTKSKKNKFNISDALDKRFLGELLIFLKKIIITIKPDKLIVDFIYGFEDPSITGSVAGFAYYLESLFPYGDINIQPVFDKEVFSFSMSIAGKVAIGAILIKTIRFILKKDVRNKLKLFKKAETFS